MRFLTAIGIATLSSPAWAHEGLHLHPHGLETALTAAVLGLSAAAIVYFAVRGRK